MVKGLERILGNILNQLLLKFIQSLLFCLKIIHYFFHFGVFTGELVEGSLMFDHLCGGEALGQDIAVAICNIVHWLPHLIICLLYTSPSPRDLSTSRMPSSA
eukprot:TRINITY_DN1974_c0_g1_i3.p2 TRINITY_DN1974_c0_g1~~TRINITY_DN1974_c0_g1_i3.p2  ORF type:complete len:102 (+),score=6.17 TRINITY_DN1974_c0_g1_i3:45-350(+)